MRDGIVLLDRGTRGVGAGNARPGVTGRRPDIGDAFAQDEKVVDIQADMVGGSD